MFSTSGGVQYIGGHHEYIGGISMSTLGDIMSTLGGVQYIGGYHEYIRRCSVHRGDIMMQVGKNFSISIENPNVLNIPQCTHDIPLMYS